MAQATQRRRFGMGFAAIAAGLALSCLNSAPAQAQDLIGSYVAYIGQPDLFNSKGARLSQPWQILRQDRANFHRYGISQPGDEFDPFFGSIDNRAIMERMVMNGSIDPQAAKRLVQGGATVFVRIYGSGSTGTSLTVTVAK
ncbi:hypothetical protein GCM10016455_19460 [Aliiroseovarius zhejiangensis]|uniref:Uncharacterized protein n=1 Tax=Aliiroseovarius zhejiangensis TaxID=1632025 RepID=A0ABQ3IZ47_9RHOB|nr:hypothetical protein [Aliiroseovarius zhejiangensis]GHE98817.1 hypothetical protein GCM10016455_19460 [Aliiroseovarius zhejiangensis]